VEKLDLLAVALGLAALAGINLYLTVFATGLAIHFHWVTLAPQYQSLEVLANPWIITIAGVLYFLESFADKIPWVDSIWDTVHTVIRPIGGALLAIQVLGHPSPVFTVIVALLAGSTSLITHTAKAATRLASNTSPEPFSNIGLSLGEDATVLGGLALMLFNPLLTLLLLVLGITAFFYFAPKILRGMKAKINLIALNPGPGMAFQTPTDEAVLNFQKILTDAGVPAFIRRPRGRDIYAACGQLKRTLEMTA